MTDDDHHHIVSLFTELNFGLVSQCPLDYMYLFSLGIVRKNVFLWLYGLTKTKMQSTLIGQIPCHLVSIKPHKPNILPENLGHYWKLKCGKPLSFASFCCILVQ